MIGGQSLSSGGGQQLKWVVGEPGLKRGKRSSTHFKQLSCYQYFCTLPVAEEVTQSLKTGPGKWADPSKGHSKLLCLERKLTCLGTLEACPNCYLPCSYNLASKVSGALSKSERDGSDENWCLSLRWWSLSSTHHQERRQDIPTSLGLGSKPTNFKARTPSWFAQSLLHLCWDHPKKSDS